jgi:adhesin transport system outer membrane protein
VQVRPSPVSPLPSQSVPLMVHPLHGEAPEATDAPDLPPAQRRPDLGLRALPGGLPPPSSDPLKIDPARDPILALAREASPVTAFQAAVAAAVTRNPGLQESVADREEAQAARNEARARRFPTVDLSLSHFEVVSRAFSDDPLNILERQRPRYRTDGTAHLQQAIVDFGASGSRIRAADERLQAAAASIDDASTQIALRAIAAWYNVFGYRALVRLGDAFLITQNELKARIDERVETGAAAPGDVAQVESYIAASNAQLADFRRSLANAEAQYAQLVGTSAPAGLARAPEPDLSAVTGERIADDATSLPAVRAARFGANAARQDVKAVRADGLPAVGGGIDYGRYGVIENAKDYDLRANVTLSVRLFGGAKQRLDQAKARAHGAEARYQRTLQEGQRDAQIALSDVRALEQARQAIEDNYLASRQSRDVLAERFRVSRGTLFDLLAAENNYFGVAARYIQTVTELDTARYVLLARTGRLLGALTITHDGLDPR